MQVHGIPPTEALVEEAIAASGLLPPLVRLAELDEQLRAQLGDLLPVVQAQADGLNRGTTAWDRRARALRGTRNALAEEFSSDRRFAAMQVSELGRRLNELDGYSAGDAPVG